MNRDAQRMLRSMKKPNPKRQKWLLLHAQNALRRRMKTRGRPYIAGRFVRGQIRIPAPALLCLNNNFVGVVQLIDKLERFIPNGRTFVDFQPIKSISADAALLLAAMLDMWQRLRSITLGTRNVDRWAPETSHMFASLGLFELLNTPGRPLASRQKSVGGVQILKLCSGQGTDGSLANHLTQSLRAIAGEIEEQALYVGLTEAMTNVGQHAYPKELFRGIPEAFRRWWMTGSYDPSNGRLTVLILDIGVGIPNTLPRSSFWEQAKGILARYTEPDDADRIDAAVQVGRTSTNSQGRGNGLDDIRKFVEQSPNGKLRILSGQGEVVYTTGNVHPEKITHPVSIPGTLIEWEVTR